jgi:hypothetical protein
LGYTYGMTMKREAKTEHQRQIEFARVTGKPTMASFESPIEIAKAEYRAYRMGRRQGHAYREDWTTARIGRRKRTRR